MYYKTIMYNLYYIKWFLNLKVYSLLSPLTFLNNAFNRILMFLIVYIYYPNFQALRVFNLSL